MKEKISILVWVALIFGAGGAAAQSHYYHLVNDTVYGMSPIYYYDWWPTIDSNGLVQDSIIFPIEEDRFLRLMRDGGHYPNRGIFQFHTTDTPLKVIGIASTMMRIADSCWTCDSSSSSIPLNPIDEVDTNWDTSMHYVLLSATPTGVVEVARVCWTDDYMTHPKRYMALPNSRRGDNNSAWNCDNITAGYKVVALREYYFESPIWVTDSFYLGWYPMKRWDKPPTSEYIDEEVAYFDYYYRHQFKYYALTNRYNSHYCRVNIPCSKFRIILNIERLYPHFFLPQPDENPEYVVAEGNQYLTIFPIIEIDSTKVPYNPADFCCPAPSNLSTVIHQSHRLKVRWDVLNNFEWELAITTSDSTSPDSCTIIPCSTNSYDTYGIHPDSTYYVYVRGKCDVYRWADTMWSEWSAPLVVEALNGSGPDDPDDPDPGDTTAIRPAEGPVFSLSPNPTESTVTVATVETDGTVALLDLQGRMLFTVPLTDPETVVDLRTLPPGTYLVRVSTPRGSTTQKLTVGR